jgi:hypothetical protein
MGITEMNLQWSNQSSAIAQVNFGDCVIRLEVKSYQMIPHCKKEHYWQVYKIDSDWYETFIDKGRAESFRKAKKAAKKALKDYLGNNTL